MYIDLCISPQPYWGFVNELDDRDLDLGYPIKAVKAVKKMYFDIGDKAFIQDKNYIVYKDENNEDCVCPLKGLMSEALKFFFINKSLNVGMDTPDNKTIADLFMTHDKYFHMMATLNADLGHLYTHILKEEFFGYAAIEIGRLIKNYNLEVFKFINQYFYRRAKRNKDGNYEYYYVNGNIGYAISPKPYIAIILYKAICKNKELTWEVEDPDKVELKVLYENYNIYAAESKNPVIEPSGSFLIDCKKIANYCKISVPGYKCLEFHDLMEYGPYTDKLMSIENMRNISEIFGFNSWLETFFLAIALYCDNYIKIESEVYDGTKALVASSTSLVDPNKIDKFDLFLKAVDYIDSIYDSIVVYPKK